MEPRQTTDIVRDLLAKRSARAEIGAKQNFEKGLFHGLKQAMAEMAGTIVRLLKQNTYSVKVENQIQLPKVQKVEGEVSLKDLRSILLGLNEVVSNLKNVEKTTSSLSKALKPEKADFSSLEKAVKSIKIPETKIPAPAKTIEVSNLGEITKSLTELSKKFNIKFPDIHIPEQRESIAVTNLEAIEGLLAEISTKVQEKEEEPVAFSWRKDKNGRLESLTEVYPSGKVTSTGWNIGSVTIQDDRAS